MDIGKASTDMSTAELQSEIGMRVLRMALDQTRPQAELMNELGVVAQSVSGANVASLDPMMGRNVDTYA